jgi:hypothetical protein
MISVNATGCGKGKSTHNQHLIKTNKDTRFLVIVPSKALADEYGDAGCGTVIHSSRARDDETPLQSLNVRQRIFEAIESNTRVIVITQKAFLDFPNKHLLCEHRTVLQDEHLEVYYTSPWRMANHMTWLPMFEVALAKVDGWFEVSFNTTVAQEFLATEDFLDNKQFVEDLLNTPQRIFTNRATLEADSMLFRVISPEIYAGADDVHIACANFTQTRQHHIWSKLFDAEFQISKPFERYMTPNLTVHHAEQRCNSKTFNSKNECIRDAVINYIHAQCSDPVYIDNNANDTQAGWSRVNHNCHGINTYRDRKHLAVLSAINYSNLVSTFLHDIVGMSEAEVRNALIGEMAHQVVMRGALRTNNDSECHIYLMEAELANYLTSCVFDGATTQAISSTSRPPKSPPMTAVERKKATLLRKRFEHLKDMTGEQLMNDPIWQITNTNGLFLKSYLKQLNEGAGA